MISDSLQSADDNNKELHAVIAKKYMGTRSDPQYTTWISDQNARATPLLDKRPNVAQTAIMGAAYLKVCCRMKLFSNIKADMKSYILLETAASHIFSCEPISKNRVLARCMLWLISFVRANSGCKERKPRITR